MNKTDERPTVLLKHYLKKLRLPTILRECEETAKICARDNVGYLDYLLRLVEAEVLSREDRAAKRRLNQAKFPNIKTLESFSFEKQPSINKLQIIELMRCHFIDEHESVIFLGQPGTGKTHLAIALGVKACQLGKKVRFFRVTDLITKMQEVREALALERFKRSLESVDLLILDELGYVPASKTGSELFFDIISAAYERTSVVVTTNLPFEQWDEVLGDTGLTGAVLDRLTHHCNIINITGESYRIRTSKIKLTGGKRR